MSYLVKTIQKQARVRRVRSRVFGVKERPRLAIERTTKHFRAQLIDDQTGQTLLAAGDHELTNQQLRGIAQAVAVGTLLGEKAKQNQITTVVFDRRGYSFHGRVAAFAEAVRKTDIVF